MAKRMAMLEEGRVVNLLWCSDLEPETDTMVNTGAAPAQIGDSYKNGKFLRDGEVLQTASDILSAIQEAGITVEPRPIDLPTRPGYEWKPIQMVAGGSVTWVLSDYDPTLPGTKANPITFKDGMEVLQNYNYIRDGVMKVWFGSQHAHPAWDDANWVDEY